jgi:hypothetical protein
MLKTKVILMLGDPDTGTHQYKTSYIQIKIQHQNVTDAQHMLTLLARTISSWESSL